MITHALQQNDQGSPGAFKFKFENLNELGSDTWMGDLLEINASGSSCSCSSLNFYVVIRLFDYSDECLVLSRNEGKNICEIMLYWAMIDNLEGWLEALSKLRRHGAALQSALGQLAFAVIEM